MRLYFISGLGADKRVFNKLILSPYFEIRHLEWIPPTDNESISSYVKKLANKIDTSQPFSIIGLSFGGIIASELSKIVTPIQTIIISSISSCNEIPWYYKFLGKIRLYNFIPSRFLKSANGFTFWLFGAKQQEEKELLTQILNDTDTVFFNWAITKIITWNNNIKLKNLVHIHGTSDHILPIKFISPNIKILNGGHLMVYSKYAEISKLLSDILVIS